LDLAYQGRAATRRKQVDKGESRVRTGKQIEKREKQRKGSEENVKRGKEQDRDQKQ
jgi:hypothetical protein